MKYLSDYVEKAQTAAFEKAGAFFAFSNKQLEGKVKKGVKYVNMGIGLICPKDTADQLFKDLESINKGGIKKDLKENGVKGVIKRELYNHECFYTGSVEDAVDKLESYGISREEVIEVYKEERETAMEYV